mgnify:CR=1 FL=1|jgi:hypothetical protein
MIISYYANAVRKANEKFYGSLQLTDKHLRIQAADEVVKQLNFYIMALHDAPEELAALKIEQQRTGVL